ncbi:MAG: YebC/PmpR family DNA-binding transcriptional regulator [Chloroflexi bacterium]|nr:MAG: YebC/PmpR family DNA-binding transcriptional regulator [Chloroflexota bacterium]TMD83174.1 MAG: YebC/PmpR family DNA-binding transcriptional regulator [Chloroflexota bacterium]
MSGHSKWSSIKHKKALTDAKKGQQFTKVARELTIAAREGGGNPEGNYRLRLAMEKARDVNMPQDNIQRAIKRGTGELGGAQMEELRFEGYGPHGVAIMVVTVTDNRNRTSGDIRNLFSRAGGNLGTTGSVAWMFTRQGQIVIDANGRDPDEVGLEAIDLGASDARVDGKTVDVVTDPARLETVQQSLKKKGYKIDSAEVTMNASQVVSLDEGRAPSVLKLLDALEEHDDVQSVYSNIDVPADVMERISERV